MQVLLNWSKMTTLFLLIILSGSLLTLASPDSAERDTSSGDICDPTISEACENSSEKCVWDDRDMLYKCIIPRPDKAHGYRQKVPKKKRLSPSSSASDTSANSKIIKTTSTSTLAPSRIGTRTTAKWIFPKSDKDQDPLKLLAQMEDHPASETDSRKFKRHNSPPVKAAERDPAGQSSVTHSEHPPSDDTAAVGRQGSNSVPRKTGETDEEFKAVLGEKTLAVPKYKGKLVWNGDPDQIVPCTPKHEMEEALEKFVPGQDKLDWLEKKEGTICGFTKFFHCVMVSQEDDTTAEPMCRCYDSSMVVVNGKCYLPANFGAKSICGSITAPYPIRPWRGAPNLMPSCTPNSVCQESSNWSGKRCMCKRNAKLNPKTHGCDGATRVGGGWTGGIVMFGGFSFYAICLLINVTFK